MVARAMSKATTARYRTRISEHLGKSVALVCDDGSLRSTFEMPLSEWQRLHHDGVIAAVGPRQMVILGRRGAELAGEP